MMMMMMETDDSDSGGGGGSSARLKLVTSVNVWCTAMKQSWQEQLLLL